MALEEGKHTLQRLLLGSPDRWAKAVGPLLLPSREQVAPLAAGGLSGADSAASPPVATSQVPSSADEGHPGFRCDGCGADPIVGVRHHATDMDDYDLCQSCYDCRADVIPGHDSFTSFTEAATKRLHEHSKQVWQKFEFAQEKGGAGDH